MNPTEPDKQDSKLDKTPKEQLITTEEVDPLKQNEQIIQLNKKSEEETLHEMKNEFEKVTDDEHQNESQKENIVPKDNIQSPETESIQIEQEIKEETNPIKKEISDEIATQGEQLQKDQTKPEEEKVTIPKLTEK